MKRKNKIKSTINDLDTLTLLPLPLHSISPILLSPFLPPLSFPFLVFSFFVFPPFPLFSFLLPLLLLPSFVFTTWVFLVLASTVSHIPLGILSSSLPLSSSQSQGYGELAMASPGLPSTSVPQLCLFLFSLYALGSRCLPLPYARLVPLY